MRYAGAFLTVLVLLLCAPEAPRAGALQQPIPSKCAYSVYPDPCTQPTTCAGSTFFLTMAHHGHCSDASGGWDSAGTGYSGAGHAVNGLYPKLRFWEFDRFMTANNGCQDQAIPGLEALLSGRDYGCSGYDSMWYAAQLSWSGSEPEK